MNDESLLPDLDLATSILTMTSQEVETALDLQEKSDRHKLRKDILWRVYYIIVATLICMGILILLAGYRLCGFHLGDSVLIALFTSTLATILGLFHFVMRYLFLGKT